MIKYKIIETDTSQHSIVVRFYTDIVTEAMLSVDTLDGIIRRCRTDYSFDLPIPAPTGTALHDFIVARAPTAWLQTQEDVLNSSIDTSLAAIIPLLGIEVEIEVVAATNVL
jgi:hypothetical protein